MKRSIVGTKVEYRPPQKAVSGTNSLTKHLAAANAIKPN